MSDMLKAFFTGVEDFAKKMKEHSLESSEQSSGSQELVKKVALLTDRVDKLLNLLEGKLGTAIKVAPVKGKRMMDIKKRIDDIIAENPKGIRPPQIAKTLGTKVQNLYPHLKAAVSNKRIIKDKTGTYFPLKPKEKKPEKTQ
ncbi:MAG: hypothetical protein JXQ83_05125 [Candidatus Glassbacteria bacterium]|nr:hypothetical protein [Candidatus Glassbacteria bacterium]